MLMYLCSSVLKCSNMNMRIFQNVLESYRRLGMNLNVLRVLQNVLEYSMNISDCVLKSLRVFKIVLK